jgi:signal transduction histidine kinase
MKYDYLQKIFQNDEYIEYNDSVKDKKRLKFIFYALVLMGLHNLVVILLYVCYHATLTIYLFMVSAGFLSYILLSIVIYLRRRKKGTIKIVKIFMFFIIYGIQMYRVITLIFPSSEAVDKALVMRNLYILFTISFTMMIFFLKLNLWSVGVVSCFNLVPAILMQIYLVDHVQNDSYVLDIWMGCFLLITSIIKRWEFGQIIHSLHKNLQMNDILIKYVDSLIDNLPSSFFTIKNKKIVYMNDTMKKFLIPENSHEENTNSFKTENKILISDNNNSPDPKYIATLAKEFLTGGKFSYIDPKFMAVINSESITELTEEIFNLESIFDLSCLSNVKLKEEKFYFIGEYEYTDIKTLKKTYHHINIRINCYENKTWNEVLMTDITLSKNLNLLSELVQARQKLLSRVAHEFKTPLICITSLADEIQTLATSQTTVSSKSSIMTKIKEKIYHLNNLSSYTLYLVKDISNYLSQKSGPLKSISNSNNSNNSNKITNNQQVMLNYEPINLSEILEFCYKILLTLLSFNRSKISIVKPIIENSIDVILNTDGLRLKQIILNFISNAVKFTNSGSIKLKTEIYELKQLKFLKISVQDTGTGILKSDFKNIFVEEKMLETNLKMNQMGNGLGLCISQQVANLLGYQISFTSEFGIGSIFSIAIPLSDKEFIPFPLKNSKSESNLNEQATLSDISDATVVKSWDCEIFDKLKESEFFDRKKSKLQDQIIKTPRTRSLISETGFVTNKEIKTKEKERTEFNKYLLIIDDVELILKSLERTVLNTLEKHNIKDVGIILGRDGVDTLNEIVKDQTENKIICIFIDEHMTYLNGNETIDIIRLMEKKGRIKKQYICKTSSSIDDENKADNNIPKPIPQNALYEIFQKLKLL